MFFGDRLKVLREEKKLTQAEIGKAVGISGRVIGYYESNDRLPKDEFTLVKLADFFGVSLDWLLGRTEVRSLVNENPNNLFIDVSSLQEDDKIKIHEYAEMIKQLRQSKK